MLTRWNDFGWNDFERSFADFDAILRRMAQGVPELQGVTRATGGGFRATLHDDGEHFVLRALLPGVKEEDLTLELDDGVLTLSGHREVTLPDGFTAHLRERGGTRFSRAFELPGPVDPERTRASLAHGVLTVEVAKAAASHPRRIEVEVA